MEELMSCLVPSSPPEAHLAFSGARAHSNNTAEMTAMIEAIVLSLLMVQWPGMSSRVFFMTLNMLLVFA